MMINNANNKLTLPHVFILLRFYCDICESIVDKSEESDDSLFDVGDESIIIIGEANIDKLREGKIDEEVMKLVKLHITAAFVMKEACLPLAAFARKR